MQISEFHQLLQQSKFSKKEIITLLQAEGDNKTALYKRSNEVKLQQVGNKVYFRGLVEFSNICAKDCLYCGIRKSNSNVDRYNLGDDQILEAAQFAYDNDYGSVVLQSGEISSPAFTARIENLLKKIKALSNGELGITISLGEQDAETYQRWFDAGAHRYLLRIETSNTELYGKIHPTDKNHNHAKRLECLHQLRSIGYQTGTGVMIGMPFQTTEDLANDLLFMQDFGVDMVGMGPFIEHEDTPLYIEKDLLVSQKERFDMTLKMIAILRIMMKDINIAAATALQAIDPLGREKAVKVGANIIMPNITPGIYRNNYDLYQNKPCVDEEPDQCKGCLDARISLAEGEIGYKEWGDSKYFYSRKKEE